MLKHYDGTGLFIEAISRRTGRSKAAICNRLGKLELRKRINRRWSQAEIDYLTTNQGLISDEDICRKLGRSVNALHVVRVRKVHAGMKSNILTARQVAEMLGVSCAKTIIFWYSQGWLQGKRAPYCQGKNRVWSFNNAGVEACLKLRPWLVDLTHIQDDHLREFVQKEYELDPWYLSEEANAILGLHNKYSIPRFVKQGLLQAEKKPKPGGSYQWRYIIRKSELDRFITTLRNKEENYA